MRVPVPKGVKVPQRRVRVLLPDGYDRGTARYPTVYLLHGVADSYTSWTDRTDIVAFTKRTKALIVMPDGGHGSDAGWYSDWSDGSRQWETFHTKVLVRYIDRTFRTTGRRAVVGNSMGGFGAMSYAARHRGLFHAAATFSGAVDTLYGYPASGPFFHYLGAGYEGNSAGTPNESVWGSQLTHTDRWRAHNPTDLAPKLKGTWLYVSAGMGTPGGPEGEDTSDPASYGFENFIFQMNLNFTRALDDAGVRYTSDFHAGYHDWPYWQRDIHKVLPKLVKAISS